MENGNYYCHSRAKHENPAFWDFQLAGSPSKARRWHGDSSLEEFTVYFAKKVRLLSPLYVSSYTNQLPYITNFLLVKVFLLML